MKKILIVDDLEENVYFLRALLTGNGFAVESAPNGASALVKARQAPPDMVVSDLLMPVMDGYTLLRHWKADTALTRVPFVVYTATYTREEDEQLALSLGADEFIIKPADPAELMEKLRRRLANPNVPRQPQSDETNLLQRYSEVLNRKLEEKMLQVEQTNQTLREDIEKRRNTERELQMTQQQLQALVAQLQESEESQRAIFEQAAVGVAQMDLATGRFVRINQRYCDIIGRTREDMASLSFMDVTHADDVAKDVENVARLRNGEVREFTREKRYLKKDGTPVWVALTVSAMSLAGEKANYSIAVVQDITERKTILEQMMRTQRMEVIGTLASGLAHDLNNILAAMMMAAGLLKEKLTDPRDRTIVRMIESSAQRGSGVIRQLLTFSRGLGGQRVSVQLRHLINDMVELMRETFPRNITVVDAMPKDVWPVVGDATQLHQVLMNLCVNARDAMPRGGSIRLSARNLRLEPGHPQGLALPPGEYVMVEVKDTGQGISPEIIGRIFDSFFSTKSPDKGTGLGLATVQNIVKEHGGLVAVESKPGEGATFKVYLPATSAHGGAEIVDADQHDSLPHGQGELILVVDDEIAIREPTRALLDQHGYRVLSAGNGEEAMQVFVNHRDSVRLVVTDVMMPVIDGVEMARMLRILNPALKILVVCGSDEEIRRKEFEEKGVPDMLTKPCEARLLLKTVHAMLNSA